MEYQQQILVRKLYPTTVEGYLQTLLRTTTVTGETTS